MVALVGDTIDLVCEVDTTRPVKDIKWKVNGNTVNNTEKPTENEDTEGVFVEEHFLMNIIKDMDGSRVSCEYTKDDFFDTREAILHVFKLDIEASEEVCESCEYTKVDFFDTREA